MDTRGGEAPMEFEWQGTGPVDPSSPFILSGIKKRPFETFQSPTKPEAQRLREPNSQPFFFSATSSQPNNVQYRAPSFTTPRKPFDVDYSSPPDDSSPASVADNEDTPEAKPMSTFKPANKRNSLFGFYGRYAPPRSAKKYSEGIARKLHKKRRRAINFEEHQGRRSSEDASEDEQKPRQEKRKPSQPQPQEVGWMAGTGAFLAHPIAPAILTKYMQLFFNAIMLGGILYMILSFYLTIQADVNRASEEAASELLAEMAACSKNYLDNRCGANNRLPALEAVCQNWELCMNRDPNSVRRARLSAQTFAEIFNSFIEPITLKTFAYTCTIIVLILVGSNAAFFTIRRSYTQDVDQFRHVSNPYQQFPPQAIQMGQFAATPGFPYGQHGGIHWQGNMDDVDQQRMLEFSRSPSKEHRARTRSPEKRAVY